MSGSNPNLHVLFCVGRHWMFRDYVFLWNWHCNVYLNDPLEYVQRLPRHLTTSDRNQTCKCRWVYRSITNVSIWATRAAPLLHNDIMLRRRVLTRTRRCDGNTYRLFLPLWRRQIGPQIVDIHSYRRRLSPDQQLAPQHGDYRWPCNGQPHTCS